MAPEQARGEIEQVDERADVFALGSIFCETAHGPTRLHWPELGRDPRKAARGDLADAVARLDQNDLGHDPELIALAKSCLAPERDDRPRHAGEVATRTSQYHSRVQERLRQSEIERAAAKARAEEATKRATVERQRMRLTVALAASVLGFIVLGGGGWAYVSQQRAARQAATERVVTEALDKATLLRGQAKAAPIDDPSKWTEALAAANEARASLEAGEPSVALRSRVTELLATLEKEQAEAVRQAAELLKDQRLFDRLEAIRFEYVDNRDAGKTNAAYATAFREFGVDVDQLEPEEGGRLFRQRSKPQEFASRLDDWTLMRKGAAGENDKDSWKRLSLTAQATDEDPWRNSLRLLIGKQDQESVRSLVSDDKELSRQPARSLYLLAQVLESARDEHYHEHYLKESIDVLKRAWRLSPNDYQICQKLGEYSENDLDRVSFSVAAVAAKPERPDARLGLAELRLPSNAIQKNAMTATIWLNKGQEAFEDTPDMKTWSVPRLAFKSKEGLTLLMGPMCLCDPKTILKRNLGDAIADLRSATRLAPGSAYFHIILAVALVLQERYDDAINESQLAARIDPKYSQVAILGRALPQRTGRSGHPGGPARYREGPRRQTRLWAPRFQLPRARQEGTCVCSLSRGVSEFVGNRNRAHRAVGNREP